MARYECVNQQKGRRCSGQETRRPERTTMLTITKQRGVGNDPNDEIPYGRNPPGDEANGASTGVDDAATEPVDTGSSEPQEQESDYVPSPSEQMALDASVADTIRRLK